MGNNFMDEIDCGNFFDQIDDLIEFPPDNECDHVGSKLVSPSDGCTGFSNMWNDMGLPDSDPLFSGSHVDSVPDLSAELSLPYEDIVQLEWLSTFVDDSFSGQGMTLGKENLCLNKEDVESSSDNQFWKENLCLNNEDVDSSSDNQFQTSSPVSDNQFQTSSPVSVLESCTSSSTSTSCEMPVLPFAALHRRGPHKARSKRPRPATFNPRPAIQFIATPGFPEQKKADNPSDATVLKPDGRAEIKKKPKKIKITLPAGPPSAENNQRQDQAVRKCLHCEITQTPQWRAGPMGPKTLCNACGVRYKSGRLFPEYRPAASPTFIPSVHSNSHKKVLEMRNKVGPGSVPETNPSVSG